nr:outer membrane protein assembly factor BamA [Desulfobacterales bacterium]
MLSNIFRTVRLSLFFFLLSIIFLGARSHTWAKDSVHVVILPFEVHAGKRLDYLREEIPELIKNRLREEGVTVVEPISKSTEMPEEGIGLERLRALGVDSGADYVVWGSFTQIGERFSLDAKILDSYRDTPAETLFQEGEGLETLLSSIQRLATEVSIKVFKREKIAKIEIAGNKWIESEAIRRVIKSREGDIYLRKNLQKDLKSIYKMGYFDDVRVEATETQGGKVVVFRVVEKGTIRSIHFKGNRVIDNDKLRQALDIKAGSVLNIYKIQNNVKIIENLYKEKGYYNVKVSYKIYPVKKKQSNLEFIIQEGEKFLIKEIVFEGNRFYDSKTLKGLMKTKEKSFFSWLTSSGKLDPEVLSQDVSNIATYYHNHGFIQAKVGDPEITFKGRWIYVKIKIEEGPQVKIGKVSIEGDLILPEEELLRKIKLSKETVYNREVIREDIMTLSDLYADKGYAYVDISPRLNKDLRNQKVDVTYFVTKGKQVFFEKIIIAGNTKTRDKVIRRQLDVYEQEVFSSSRLKKSVRNLYRLDYFDDIKINTISGSGDDRMILKIDVQEKPTGAFMFGGGYSSVDHLFATISISQRNLFGKGQILDLRASSGGRTTQYDLSFTEPWLFDIPLSAGFDIYNLKRDYDTYDKDSFGGKIRFGYKIFAYTRIYFSYNYDKADISITSEDASFSIKDMEGTNVTHGIGGNIRRDTRDRIFNPTEGSDNMVSVYHAGRPFGGDIGFTRYIADSGWYIPLFWETVGVLHGRIGFIHGEPGRKLPVYERFYLGGINSIRGFDWRDISPKDPKTGDKIGGNKMIQFNLELLFPLIKKAGFMGVLFFDAGNAFNNGEELDISRLRKSVGYGVRWYSPLGPIRLEYGYVLDPDPGQGRGGWEFTMGMAF